MSMIEITEQDLELVEGAIIKVSGGDSFGFCCKGMKLNTLKGIWALTDGLRKLAQRIRETIAEDEPE